MSFRRAREWPAGTEMTTDSAAKSDIAIRFASPDDADRLAALSALTFREAFAHLYPPRNLADFLADSHSPTRYAGWLADPAFGVLIAERGGEAIGYALAGPCHLPHPEVTPGCGELWRLYLRASAQGTGLGGQLLAISLDWLAAPGRRLWIGVWSRNFGAQRLYARHGFERVGEYQFAVGRTLDEEFILSRAAG
jgi:GNAT superfamily N-acetyltransferase